MKVCPKCGPKPDDCFPEKSRLPWCKECKRQYNKDWYVKNKEAHKEGVRTNNIRYGERNRAIVEVARNQPCKDCGQKFEPCVMEFDHRDPSKKIDCVARLMGRSSEAALLAEMEKCDVVCANCHRRRTHFREAV